MHKQGKAHNVHCSCTLHNLFKNDKNVQDEAQTRGTKPETWASPMHKCKANPRPRWYLLLRTKANRDIHIAKPRADEICLKACLRP